VLTSPAAAYPVVGTIVLAVIVKCLPVTLDEKRYLIDYSQHVVQTKRRRGANPGRDFRQQDQQEVSKGQFSRKGNVDFQLCGVWDRDIRTMFF